MKMTRASTAGPSLAILLWATLAGAAAAQSTSMPADANTTPSADPTSIGEVVVTSRRSAEKLQDVPLSIESTSATQLQERHITDLNSLAKYIPGLSFKDFVTGFHGNPTIRGMTQINTADAVTNVGVFIDGVYLQRDYQLNQSLGDFSRIEVVKGPQSALYGANTFAGAINYVTNRPTDYYTGDGEITLGNAGEQRFQAGVGGPIVKGILDGRLYLGSDKYDGTISNNLPGASGTDKHFGNHDRRAYSAELKFTPTDAVSVEASYTHTEKSEGIRAYYTLSGSFAEDQTNCGTVNKLTGRPELFCGTFPTDPSKFRTGLGSRPAGLFTNVEPQALGQNDIIRVSSDWKINSAFTAHYTFGATRGSESEDFVFFSNTYNPVLTPAATTFSQQIEGGQIHYTSHELRLNYDDGKPYKFELGYFHSDSDDRYFLGIKFVPITGAVLGPLTRASQSPLYAPPGTLFLNNLDEKFSVDAVFGRASYTFLDDRATLAAELRYTKTDLTFTNLSVTKPQLKASYDDPVPRLTAEYKLSRDNLLYASVAEGVKTGGFNGYVTGSVTLLPSEQSYAEEKNWTYELGSKNTFLNRALFLNFDFFYIDWPDKLAAVAPANAPVNTAGAPATSANIYEIAGNATNYGIEFEGQYRPIPPLTISFSGTAQHPTYGNGTKNTGFIGYCATACSADGSVAGHTLERESELSGVVGVEYRDHLREGWDYFGGLDLTYQSMQYADQENLSKISPYSLVDGHVGFANERYKIFVWAKNLGDKKYIDNVFYVQSQRQFTASFGERRTFGVTLTGAF